MSEITVRYAVYGALAKGNENDAQAADVTSALQNAINDPKSDGGIVTINNASMGGDPSKGNGKGNGKHFGAAISRDGGMFYFACAEGQTIAFQHGGRPAGA